MSHLHSIKILLNIKDKNINILENSVTFENLKGINTKIIHAKLTYSADKCPHCQAQNIIKWGTKITNIKILKIAEYNSVLRLQKQRFKCKSGGKTFTADTDFVNKNYCISNDVKLAVTLGLQNITSEKHIAENLNISSNTVNKIVNSFDKEHLPNKNFLPEVLCFDEFKAAKDCEGAVAFIYCDWETGKIIDILSDRRLTYLKEYFSQFSLEVRNKVKHIVIDMYV